MRTQLAASAAGEFSVSAFTDGQPAVITLLRRFAVCHAIAGLETAH
jgi:hypothetical protein